MYLLDNSPGDLDNCLIDENSILRRKKSCKWFYFVYRSISETFLHAEMCCI